MNFSKFDQNIRVLAQKPQTLISGLDSDSIQVIISIYSGNVMVKLALILRIFGVYGSQIEFSAMI